jgi:hypothetical protein
MKGGVCALPLRLAGFVFPRGLSLGLCSPAPARNPQQEKQCCSVKETQVRNGIAAGSTHVEEMYVKSSEHPKDQREDSADQT